MRSHTLGRGNFSTPQIIHPFLFFNIKFGDSKLVDHGHSSHAEKSMYQSSVDDTSAYKISLYCIIFTYLDMFCFGQ